MCVRNDDYGNMSKLDLSDAQFSTIKERVAPRPKFNASIENKIEQLWLQSRHLRWSYNEFATHLLEVLVILQHRDRMQREAASKPGVAA
jgi:hypothetical protein